MLGAIVYREFSALIRDGRYLIVASFFTIMVLLSILVSQQAQETRSQFSQRLTTELRSEWESQREKDPHSAGHFGTYVIKPGGPLNWLDPGLEPYLGSVGFLEAHLRNDFVHRPATEMTSARQFGYFSPAFLLQVIAPLLIILFCFSSFAGDRESGVLRLTLSTGVNPSLLATGKILGCLLGISAFIAPSLVLASLFLNRGASGADAIRLSLLIGGYLLYYLTFASLTLWVSSLVSKSQVALASMIVIWISGCFVLPRTISDVAAANSPLPSKAAFAHKVALETLNGIDGHDPQDARRSALLKKTLEEYKVTRVEDLPVNFDAIALQASEDYTSALYQREFDKVAAQLESQTNVVRASAFLAPYVAMRNWSTAVVGTDFAHHRRFSDSVERYRQDLIRKLNTDMIQNSRTGEYGYFVEQEFWKKVSPFEYQEPEVSWSIKDVYSQLGALLAWAVISSALCLSTASRMRP